MKKSISALGVLALGAAAMYFGDPSQGQARRKRVADGAIRFSDQTRAFVARRSQATADGARGLAARLRNRVLAIPANDEQLRARVEIAVQRAVSFPEAVSATVQGGNVSLLGDVLERQFNCLMGEVWQIPGVKAVENRLVLRGENDQYFSGTPHRVRRAATRHMARDAAAALAIAGGVGSGLGAIRTRSTLHLGLLSAAAGLLFYGLGGKLLIQRPETLPRPAPEPPAKAATDLLLEGGAGTASSSSLH